MTLVNLVTGEIIDSPTEADVRASVQRVINHAESIWDEWAWQVENQTWTVLGYASWDEMRRGEYGALTSVTAPRAERPELVSRFRHAGLTQRETAETLGVSRETVQRHDEPTYAPREPKAANDASVDADIVDAEIVNDEIERTAPAPRATPRRALPDQFFDATYDLTKVTERIDRLLADDRFPQNAEKVAAMYRGDLLRAVELLSKALDRFNLTQGEA